MKKRLKKLLIMFSVFLVFFGAVTRPQKAKADALAVGTMTLVSLNPAVIPIALIGLAGVLLIGYTVTNWDDITAFGNQIARELDAMGHSVSDFISGTSVKVDNTFKSAVKSASANLKDEMPKYNPTLSYHGGLSVFSGNIKLSAYGMHKIFGTGTSMIYLGTKIENSIFERYDYDKTKDYLLSEITVIIDVAPTNLDLSIPRQDAKIIRDSTGKIIQFVVDSVNKEAVSGYYNIFISGPAKAEFTVTGVSVPQLGIGVKTGEAISTEKLKSGAITSDKVDEYINTAFPGDSTVINFSPDANVAGATVLNLPDISDMTLTGEQIGDLTKIKTGTETAIGSATGAITGSGALTDMGWLSKLWEWLLKLLNAILGIPAAILAGLQALWDILVKWLSDIIAAIQAIPGAISKAFTDALTWAFGVDGTWLDARLKGLKEAFNSKFPAISGLNYSFQDKQSFDDIRVNLPLVGTQTIVSGSAMTYFAKVVKPFISGLFYLLTALFFSRKFYKVSED